MVFVMSFLIDSITEIFSHSDEIFDHRHVLISCSFDKLLSIVCKAHFEQICVIDLKLKKGKENCE